MICCLCTISIYIISISLLFKKIYGINKSKVRFSGLHILQMIESWAPKNVPMLCLKFQNLQMSPQKHETSVMVGPSIDHGYLMLHTFLTRKKYIPTLYYYIIRCWLVFFFTVRKIYTHVPCYMTIWTNQIRRFIKKIIEYFSTHYTYTCMKNT